MSNLSKLEFVALDITGRNYLSWVLDAEIHLDTKGLGNTIIQGNEASNQDKAKAMIFFRHHLHEGLKTEYLTVKDPLELRINLKDRYDHLKLTVLPKARYQWIHLRLQDFKTVSEYNSAIFKVSSLLKLCGDTITDEDLLEKTFSTFHASNVVLQQQYREKGFKKYSELITCLLVAEQNNTLLMKNHKARPTRSAPFPKVNVVAAYDKFERKQNNYCGCGRGRNNYRHYGGNKLENNKGSQINPSKGPSNKYDSKAHLAYKDDDFGGLANITHLEAGDFFEDID
ncbi:PREDICTED: uncharacterized protein LOC109239004 [Nicotiana attenuata]|uniref:uncharacterized protein LOC109239004 n=1 Tax=Nicotiana attenuata TaxID=49451 RepID=UPI0009055904|nr:PREDICTED: uncharacterized protein LOC109239004 [Nicotiana attenuata]